MTSTRYFIALIGQAFGYFRRSQRLTNATSEMHLLREAEAQLGAMIWKNVEGIEALSIEYWNLRKLIKEQVLIHEKLAACQKKLDRAHEERTNLLSNAPASHQELFKERTALLTEIGQLFNKRDQIVAEARENQHIHIGLKMKLEVLTKESAGSPANQQEIDKVKARLLKLKTNFEQLKRERIQIGAVIEQMDVQIDLVNAKFNEHKQNRRIHASEASQEIGASNREVSLMRAESALLDTRMHQLYAEIGRYVSRHTNQDPACAAAAAAARGLVDVMYALRRSIALNHRLANNPRLTNNF
jgi:chromosome segregation ATPase